MSFMVLFAAGCGTLPVDEEVDETTQATSCAVKLAAYPVRAKHNNGYDSTAGDSSQWTCDDAHSNSDYNSTHLGNDIWAAEGAPVAATVDGTLTLTGFSSYSGNKVTIIDKCGWYHFSCHLKSIAAGMKNGVKVKAGDIIGYVGRPAPRRTAWCTCTIRSTPMATTTRASIPGRTCTRSRRRCAGR